MSHTLITRQFTDYVELICSECDRCLRIRDGKLEIVETGDFVPHTGGSVEVSMSLPEVH